MNRRSSIRGLQAAAGLLAAPLAWMAAMQLGQTLPYLDCAYKTHSTAFAAMAAIAVALSAAVVSWPRGKAVSTDQWRVRRFVGSIAGLTALVISFALALQFLASLMLNACER